MTKQTQYQFLRDEWPRMSIYQRFESVVTLILMAIIGIIIVVSLYRLGGEVISGILFGILDPLDQNVFQVMFAEVLTVMIALEFNHTLLFVVPHQQSIIQTKVVLLISLLALARKVIVLDLGATPAAELAGLGALILALGGVYWLMRERDDRQAAASGTTAG